MGIIAKLKTELQTVLGALGLAGSSGRSGNRDTTVTVEREPSATAERAVTEPEPATRPADESASTARPDEAAEPAEPIDTPETDETPSEDAAVAPPEEATEAPSEDEAADEPVDTIKGIGPAYAERLREAGITTVSELAGADAAELSTATDVSAKRVQRWIDRAAAR